MINVLSVDATEDGVEAVVPVMLVSNYPGNQVSAYLVQLTFSRVRVEGRFHLFSYTQDEDFDISKGETSDILEMIEWGDRIAGVVIVYDEDQGQEVSHQFIVDWQETDDGDMQRVLYVALYEEESGQFTVGDLKDTQELKEHLDRASVPVR